MSKGELRIKAEEIAARHGFKIVIHRAKPHVASLVCTHCGKIDGGGLIPIVVAFAASVTKPCGCQKPSA